MKYPIVATDFDGTLLRTDLTISDYTKDVINSYRKAGGKFLIATGRMHSGIKSQLVKAGLDSINFPLISYQGGVVRNSLDDMVLYDERIDLENASRILAYIERQGYYCHTYINDTLTLSRDHEFSREYARILDVGYNIVDMPLSEYLMRLIEQGVGAVGVHKILIYHPEAIERKRIQEEMSELFGSKYIVHSPSSHMVDINSKLAGKDKALAFVADLYSKSLADCLAFGDNHNDIDMVRRVGYGVAVANAVDELKRVAREVCPSNNDDGVAKTIERLCL